MELHCQVTGLLTSRADDSLMTGHPYGSVPGNSKACCDDDCIAKHEGSTQAWATSLDVEKVAGMHCWNTC